MPFLRGGMQDRAKIFPSPAREFRHRAGPLAVRRPCAERHAMSQSNVRCLSTAALAATVLRVCTLPTADHLRSYIARSTDRSLAPRVSVFRSLPLSLSHFPCVGILCMCACIAAVSRRDISWL